MTDDETTTEQLAEIEGQAESTPATGYTPPEGWRVLAVGEVLQPGDEWVNWEGTEARPDIQHGDGTIASGGRYIRRIEQEPQAEPEPQPEPQPEPDAELRIRLLKQANDSQAETIGRLLTEARDLNMEIGGLERRLSERDARIRDLETMHAAATQAVVDAGKQNDALRNQLAAVKAELVTQAETSRQLRVELDAAQQVPADSPELRQLRADLEQVTLDRDTYRHAHELLVQDIDATHQRTKAMTVEAIVEWLVPIRTCGSQALATAVISNLPHIMRSLTGLEDEEIE